MNKVNYYHLFLTFLLFQVTFLSHAGNFDLLDNSSNFKDVREQVYIHTDREIYVAGENLFFKLYLLNGLNFELSRVAYIVLRNANQKTILKTRVWLSNNSGYGHIYIPDTLSSGQYQLVSYTNWMRGDHEQYCFTKELLIINRFDEGFSEMENSFVGSNIEFRNDSIINNSHSNLQTSDLLKLSVEKDEYSPRSKISMKIDFSSEEKEDSLVNLSISVVDLSSYFQQRKSLITDCYQKFVEGVNKRGNPIHYKDIESEGLIISGKLIKGDLEDVTNKVVFLSTPDSIVNLQYQVTDSNGEFRFMIGNYYEGKDLYIKPFTLMPNPKLGISVEDKYSLSTPYTPTSILLGKGQIDQIKKSQSIATVNKAYGTEIGRASCRERV